MDTNTKNIVQKIAQVIHDKKGMNIVALEVGHFSSVTDFLIVAEGTVDRHVMAIGQEIVKEMRDREGIRPIHVEGLHVGDWLVLDYGDIIIHLFKPDAREKYQLERLWSNGKVLSLDLNPNSPL